MYKLKSNDIELYAYKFICKLENYERSVEVTCRDKEGNHFNTRIFRPSLGSAEISISRIDVKRQGKHILNNGIIIKEDEEKKKFEHVESVSFLGKESYKTYSYTGKRKTFTDKYLPFLSSKVIIHISLYNEFTIEKNATGEFVQ